MASADWQRLKQLFHDASALSGAGREAFLRENCGDDEALLQRLRDLLAAADTQGTATTTSGGEAPARPAADAMCGRTLGDYELRQRLGHGGMGVVFLAQQLSLRREVAVKVMQSLDPASSPQIERFHSEARRVARLEHPGIVKVFADGEDGGLHWFAMELVRGHDLGTELDLQRTDDARCILPRKNSREYFVAVVRLVRDVALALDYAHRNGVVHRDVKPQNLLLRRDTGAVVVVDFGIAKDLSFGAMTATESAPGTAYYMSPEQVATTRAGVDHRTDLFSLGVVLYELLTRRRPFEGQTSRQVWDAITSLEPPPVRKVNADVPRDLELVCAKALEKDRHHRYACARDLADDLGCLLALRTPQIARAPGLWASLRRRARRHSARLWSACLLAAGAAVGMWLHATSAHAATTADVVGRLRRALTDDWDRVGHEAVVAAQRSLDTARRLRIDDPTVARLAAKLTQHAHAMRDRGQGLIDRATAPTDGATVDTRLDDVVRGLALLHDARALLPGEPEAQGFTGTRAVRPRLSVQAHDLGGGALTGKVSYRTLDLVTGAAGERVEVGPLPVEDASWPPGYHRVVVEVDGHPFREFTRYVGVGDHCVLDAAIRETDGFDGMQQVPAAVLRIPERQDIACPCRAREVALPAYWIDECEVSVGDFRKYCRAVGRPLPEQWGTFPNDRNDYDTYPAVYVSWEDARAYAEWAGKRLVSHPEFELAARGPNGRDLPWTDDPADRTYLGTTRGPNLPATPSRADDFATYLSATTPVRSEPQARTLGPVRLYHTLGNVSEWSESMFVEFDGSHWRAEPQRRFVLGGAWFAAGRQETLATHAHWGLGPHYVSHYRGFRCARSANP
ncbi:MAG: bifunctional serine/threonine-protein kinase/formylglycine-generating enzyme family protein [Planctomycetota bacterium]